MTHWYDNEAFWQDIEPVLFTEERWQAAPADVENVTNLIKLPAGANVLDLGCGVGRHAIEFARRGYRVTGADRTDRYLEAAKKKAAERNLDIELVCADMREFRREGAFDLVVNLLTTFGYFPDAADDRRVLDNVYAGLKPGGTFLIEMMGKEILARIFRARDWHEQPDGTKLLEDRVIKDGWQRLENRWIVIRGNDIREHRFQLRLYSATELQGLLEAAGFVDVAVYGSLAGAPYDDKAERLVLVGRRAR